MLLFDCFKDQNFAFLIEQNSVFTIHWYISVFAIQWVRLFEKFDFKA